jgi:hypothetical protein
MDTVRLNNFSLQIVGPNGPVSKIVKGGHNYYGMAHGTEYKLCLSSSHHANTDAHVWIDDEKVGVWRIKPYGSITIERPANTARKFTILKEGTHDASSAGIIYGNENNGLIKVTFEPEFKTWNCMWDSCIDPDTLQFNSTNESVTKQSSQQSLAYESCKPQSNHFQSAGTGLGSHSNQHFGTAKPLSQIDHANITTIYARLVIDDGPKYISLKEGNMSSIPPRIDSFDPPVATWNEKPWYDS